MKIKQIEGLGKDNNLSLSLVGDLLHAWCHTENKQPTHSLRTVIHGTRQKKADEARTRCNRAIRGHEPQNSFLVTARLLQPVTWTQEHCPKPQGHWESLAPSQTSELCLQPISLFSLPVKAQKSWIHSLFSDPDIIQGNGGGGPGERRPEKQKLRCHY